MLNDYGRGLETASNDEEEVEDAWEVLEEAADWIESDQASR